MSHSSHEILAHSSPEGRASVPGETVTLLPCPFCGEAMIKGTFEYWTHAKNDCFLHRTQLHISGVPWWNRRATDKATTAARAALVAMAEGAPYEFNDAGFLVVGNPDHAPDEGTDPFIVVDVYALGNPPASDGSSGPFGVVEDATEDALRAEDWFHDSDMGAR